MASDTWPDDIGEYLAANGLGVIAPIGGSLANADIYIGQFAADDREGILITPTGGNALTKSQSTGGLERPRMQILTRYRNYETAWTKARLAYSLLDKPDQGFSQGASRFMYSKALQPPFSIGLDSLNLARIVCNYSLWVY